MSDAVNLVERYLAAVTAFDGQGARACLHAKMQFHELPNRVRPKGGVDDLAAMMSGLARAGERKVLTAQRYLVHNVIDAGEQVVVEARWEGDLAIPLGRLKPDEMLIAHICMVFRLHDGLIVEQRNYDCYEDFSATA